MEFELFIILVIILVVLVPFCQKLSEEGNIDNYDISNAILIDSFVSYSKSGYPCYYLVYQFSDGSIKDFQVTSEKFYLNHGEAKEER